MRPMELSLPEIIKVSIEMQITESGWREVSYLPNVSKIVLDIALIEYNVYSITG
jgi:hypothetical protein